MLISYAIESTIKEAPYVVGFDKTVYDRILEQLLTKNSHNLKLIESLTDKYPNKKPPKRYIRLETIAYALHTELVRNPNGSIGFSLNNVEVKVHQDYELSKLEDAPKTEDIKNIISLLINALEFIQQSGSGSIRHKFRVKYVENRKDQYAYILPKQS